MSPRKLPLARALRNKVFFCYSNADRAVLDDLLGHLAPQERAGLIETFNDWQIQPGEIWMERIRDALATAKVAVLLISRDFLGSRFVMEIEVPELLRAESEGVVIIPVITRPCLIDRCPELNRLQATNHREPLSMMPKARRDQAVVEIAREILAALSR